MNYAYRDPVFNRAWGPAPVHLAAAFIIIKVTNKDGTVSEIKVSDSSKVEVTQNGKVVAAFDPDNAFHLNANIKPA